MFAEADTVDETRIPRGHSFCIRPEKANSETVGFGKNRERA